MKTMTSDPDPAQVPYTSRWEERDARRKEGGRVAREAAARRAARGKSVTLVDRVEKAKVDLAGKNVAGAIARIQAVSPQDYDVYLLAEKYGQARRGVMQQFGAGRKSVETAYLAEAGLAIPEDTPDEGVEE